MADTVSSQTIYDGKKRTIMKFTNVSDGTGESAVQKVDVSGLTPAASVVSIEKIIYDISGMAVDILWDATTDVRVIRLGSANDASNSSGVIDMSEYPIPNTLASGYTGDIMFTTAGHASGDHYSVILVLRK